MAHNNGVISAPVRVYEDIASVLGSSSGDVGTLCTHERINKKSRYIPFADTNNLLIVNDDIRKAHNWGHDYSVYTSVNSAIADWSSQHGFFHWRVPTTRFRVLDFDRYDHNAGDWFYFSPAASPVASNRPKLLWSLNWEDFFGTYIGNLGSMSIPFTPPAVADQFNFGFLMTQTAPSDSFAGTVYFYQVTDIRQTMGKLSDICANEDGNRIPMIINNVVPQGDWYVIPCFTDYTGFSQGSWNSIRDLDGNNLILFPFCPVGRLVVNAGGGGGQAEVVVNNLAVNLNQFIVNEIDPYNLVYEITELEYEIENNNNSAVTMTLAIEVSNSISGGSISSSASLTIAANDSYTDEPIKSDREGTWKRVTLGDSEAELVFTISLSVSGETATKQFRFPFESVEPK